MHSAGKRSRTSTSGTAVNTSRQARTQQAQYDTRKWVNVHAQNAFEHQYLEKAPASERGIYFDPITEPEESQNIRNRHWEKFCSTPPAGYHLLVREFYLNFIYREDEQVFVRGLQVPFSRTIINGYYGVPTIARDELTGLDAMDKEALRGEMLALLCVPSARWSSTYTMARTGLNTIARTWWQFVATNLSPTDNHSKISEDRMKILYAIMSGRSIDIGRLIYESVIKVAHDKSGIPRFPSLITQLCITAGVPHDALDQPVRVKCAIATASIRAVPTPAVPIRTAPPPPTETTGEPSSSSPNWIATQFAKMFRKQRRAEKNQKDILKNQLAMWKKMALDETEFAHGAAEATDSTSSTRASDDVAEDSDD